MSPPQRMRAWGIGISAGYVLLGVIGAAVLRVPGSELLFGLCALTTLILSMVTAPLLRPRRRADDGGGLRPPQPPDEPQPPWWPEFESEFRAHVERLTSVRG